MLKILSSKGKEAGVKAGEVIATADAAGDARNWPEAARLYREALDRNGSLPAIWVQYGHALKETGHLSEAEAAYRKSIEIAPQEADSHLQLGHKADGKK